MLKQGGGLESWNLGQRRRDGANEKRDRVRGCHGRLETFAKVE